MVRVAALDIQVSLRNPMASLEDSVTSVKMLYNQHCFLIQYGCISDCLLCTDSNIHNDHGLSYKNFFSSSITNIQMTRKGIVQYTNG